uniref:HAT C-terminal dimerisation domain-containing protein n=1 Tax=Salvator merianae TaxID=96440 RepID=A0A8D0KLQ8_SALMN
MFPKALSQREIAVKASFIVAAEIAKSARPFNEGEFVKKGMIKVCDVVCPDQRQAFLNMSLSRNAVADSACNLATNLHEQLMEKGKDFIAFSLAVAESSDTSDTAQLSVFIHGVDSNLYVTEEPLGLKSMHGTTTAKEILEEVSKCVTQRRLLWDKLVGLTTGGAPAMCNRKSGLVARIREKMRGENCAGELTVYHCTTHQESLCGKARKMEHVMSTITRAINFIRANGLNHCQFKSFLEECCSEYTDMPYHTEVRWLSRGKVLNRCFELREEIGPFLESKGKDTAELQDKEFLSELAFLCDITSHLDVLNLQLQGRGCVITDMYTAVRAFKTKLCLWETQMLQGNLGHFPRCQTIKTQTSTVMFPNAQFELLSKLFAVDVESAPTNLQMELDSVGATQFPRDTTPQLCTQAAPMLSMFSSTYLCEQLFSSMKMNKTSHRSRLSDEHLHSILRISSAQSLTPNSDEPASRKRCQVSGLDQACIVCPIHYLL